MAEIRTDWVTLQVADGTTMRAYVARPQDGRPRAGLLVFQEAFGVNAHIRDVTERFAREGYHALAPELFHRTAPGFEGAYNNFEAVMPHVRALKEQDLEADARSAYAWLRENLGAAETPIACIGFCMGGRVSFLTNSLLPVKAAVSFYGGGIAPNPMGPGLLEPRRRFARAATFVLGWPGQAHWPGANASGGRSSAQSRQAFCER